MFYNCGIIFDIFSPMMNVALILASFFLSISPVQQDVLNDISTAMKAGSSKELVKYCNANIEIKMDGKTNNYSIAQAEVVLRDFFLKNPPKGFQYIHQGASPEGLKYTIGTYSVEDGSYRVVMVIKNVKNQLKIDTINFSKE